MRIRVQIKCLLVADDWSEQEAARVLLGVAQEVAIEILVSL